MLETSKTPSRCTSYSRLFSIVDYFSTRPRMPTQADRSSIDSIGSLLAWMLNPLINMILMHPGGGGAITLNGVANLAWSPLFFKYRRPDWALWEVPLLWLSILAPIVLLLPLSRTA